MLIRHCILVIVLTSAGALAGEYDPSLDLWPLVRYDASPDGSQRRLEMLGPVIEWQDSPSRHEFYLRPLCNRRDDRKSRVVESEWPWPIGFGTTRPDLSRQVVFPLVLRDRETFSDASVQSRLIVLPVLYYRATREVADVLLFPLGGVLHDFLGRDRVGIFLWPLYVAQRKREARSWSILHPVFAYTRWTDGGWGFKVWPVFGINWKPGKMLKLFVLWPIGHYQRMETSQGEIRRWWVFPFFGRIRDPGGGESAVLWPLFRHRTDRGLGRDDWWMPWPVIGRHCGERARGWTLWPLWASERQPGKHRARFLWPIGWYRRTEDKRERTSSFRIVPLMFREREERAAVAETSKPEPKVSGAWQFWPLVKYRYDPSGWTEAESPSLLPMRWYGPWERNFAPFFRVFRYHRSAEGVRSWRLLGRWMRIDIGPAVRFFEVKPLFKVYTASAGPAQAGASQWNILKGLFAYRRTGEKQTWQFLYFLRVRSERHVEGKGTPIE